MEMKQQSSIEFVITYSWALLIIALFVVSVILISDTKPQSTYLASTCNIQPLLPCQESLLTYNSVSPFKYYVVFSNQLGSIIYFPPNAINITTRIGNGGPVYNIGNCTPSYAGGSAMVLCSAGIKGSKPSVGTQVILTFVISYKICSSSTQSSCPPSIYKSSGFSVQTVAPSTVNLDNLTFITNPSTGTIVLNGATYFSGTSVFLPSGNYIVYAVVPQGYGFSSWSIVSPSSTLSSTTTQNAVLTLNSNANIIATYK